jgi:hypothetical protein
MRPRPIRVPTPRASVSPRARHRERRSEDARHGARRRGRGVSAAAGDVGGSAASSTPGTTRRGGYVTRPPPRGGFVPSPCSLEWDASPSIPHRSAVERMRRPLTISLLAARRFRAGSRAVRVEPLSEGQGWNHSRRGHSERRRSTGRTHPHRGGDGGRTERAARERRSSTAACRQSTRALRDTAGAD